MNCIKLQRILYMFKTHLGFPGGSVVKSSPANAGDEGLILGSGRSPGEGNGNPLQYSCLGSPMNRGAWWAAVHGFAKSRTQLSDFHYFTSRLWYGFPGGTVVKNLPASAGDSRDAGLIPGLGRSPGVGNGNPLQYSCLENPMDRGAQWATVYGTAKSWTCLSMHLYIYLFFLTIIHCHLCKLQKFNFIHSWHKLVWSFWPAVESLTKSLKKYFCG